MCLCSLGINDRGRVLSVVALSVFFRLYRFIPCTFGFFGAEALTISSS